MVSPLWKKNNLAESVTFSHVLSDVMGVSSELRIDADFTDFADFRFSVCLTSLVVLSLLISFSNTL